MDNRLRGYKMWDQIIYPYQNFDDATFDAYQSIKWWQNSVHILLKLNDDSLFITYINYIASDNLWYLKW